MKTQSLFFRLGLASAILIVLALALAAFGLRAIFDHEIARRAAGELTQVVKTLAAQVRVDGAGRPAVDVALPDPRFEEPYGGLYWQVSAPGGLRARSRSLWDFAIVVSGDHDSGERWTTDVAGPNGSSLLAVAQRVTVSSGSGEVPIEIIAALDRNDLVLSRQAFTRALGLSLAALGGLLVLAMILFLRLALRPFDELGRGLRAIHTGEKSSLTGDFPYEVRRVVEELNRLIAFQDAALERAKTHAGDLAHGLKTPLAVLAAIARQAAGAGRNEIAAPIDEQIGLMRRQVDRVLARARAGFAAAMGRNVTVVAPVARKVLQTFERLPDTPQLIWESDLSLSARFPGEEGDLTEILGNLIDNARKWASSRIRLSVFDAPGGMQLCVEDDGPGLSPERAEQIARGQRWDETQPGSGFGLAITRDLAEGYRGSLSLEKSSLGGLRAVVTIPQAHPRLEP